MEQPFAIEYMVDRMKESDTGAFEKVYAYYYPRLYRFSKKILFFYEESIDDILQDVFIKIWERRTEIKDAQTFNAFIYAITKNALYNELKRQSRTILKAHQLYADQAEMVPDASHNPYPVVYFKDYLQLLLKMINDLPEQQRMAFWKVRIEGKTAMETAKEMNISHRTVEYHIGVAHKKLRTRFDETTLALLTACITKILNHYN